jgi:hypothetical protein
MGKNFALPDNQTLFDIIKDDYDLQDATLEKRVILTFMTEGGPNSAVADSMLNSEDKVKQILSKYDARLIGANPNDMVVVARALGLSEVPAMFFFEKGSGKAQYVLYGYFDDMIEKFENAADKAYNNKK